MYIGREKRIKSHEKRVFPTIVSGCGPSSGNFLSEFDIYKLIFIFPCINFEYKVIFYILQELFSAIFVIHINI